MIIKCNNVIKHVIMICSIVTTVYGGNIQLDLLFGVWETYDYSVTSGIHSFVKDEITNIINGQFIFDSTYIKIPYIEGYIYCYHPKIKIYDVNPDEYFDEFFHDIDSLRITSDLIEIIEIDLNNCEQRGEQEQQGTYWPFFFYWINNNLVCDFQGNYLFLKRVNGRP